MTPSACLLIWLPTPSQILPKSSCFASRGTFPSSAFVDSDILGMLNAPLPFQPLELGFQTLELDFQTLNLDDLARVHETLPCPNILTDDTLPSLLAILWRILGPRMCFPVCEYAPWSCSADTRRNTNAMQNDNARVDDNTIWDYFMKIEFQDALTIKHPKILSLVPRSLCCFLDPLLILDLSTPTLSCYLKICRFPLHSHHTVHPFCGRLMYST